MVEGIQISRNLLFQLLEDEEESKKKTRKPKPRIPPKSQQSQKQPQQKQIPNETETQKGTPAGWPLQTPVFLPTSQLLPPSNPELESIRSVLKESESVLEKLQKHEENMVKEVTQRAKELHEKEFKLPQQKAIPCQSAKDACLACYKENVNEPLKCATVVRSYQDCVRTARTQAQAPSS